MNDTKEIKIAPKLNHQSNFAFTGEDWKVGDYPTYGSCGENWIDEDWQTAIDIFEDRIRGRFLNYIDALHNFEYDEGDFHAGFAIMALDCLLIETLQQFYDGRDSSQGSEKAFEIFLTTTSFHKYFGADLNQGSLADLFYDQIRCGILHQAEAKTESRIIAYGKMIDKEGQGVVVNRKEFHRILVQEFECYVCRLRNPKGEYDLDLRKKFRQKMDFICKVKNSEKDAKLKLYFAYGSNMKQARMIKRAASAKLAGIARLSGWKMLFNKRSKDGSGKANIIRDETGDVWGVLYQLKEQDLFKLDQFESGYTREQITVTDSRGKKINVFTYIAFDLDESLEPYEDYKNFILEGAVEHQLPPHYIEALQIFPSIPNPNIKNPVACIGDD